MKLFESEFCRAGLVSHRFLLIKKEKKKFAYKFYWLEVSSGVEHQKELSYSTFHHREYDVLLFQ